jgi:hypothetical protein
MKPVRTLVRALAVLALGATLAACASTTQKQVYVEWLPITNPDALCAGKPDCVQHSTYRGKPLCTIVTADKAVSYTRLGEQVRECAM